MNVLGTTVHIWSKIIIACKFLFKIFCKRWIMTPCPLKMILEVLNKLKLVYSCKEYIHILQSLTWKSIILSHKISKTSHSSTFTKWIWRNLLMIVDLFASSIEIKPKYSLTCIKTSNFIYWKVIFFSVPQHDIYTRRYTYYEYVALINLYWTPPPYWSDHMCFLWDWW